MKEIIMNGQLIYRPESNNDILLINLMLYKMGCCVCDIRSYGFGIGYCSEHSTSGKAYLTYFPDEKLNPEPKRK